MWRMLLITLILAGCAPLPPTPQDVQARRFEAAPGTSVIYIVRTPLDSQEMSGLALDDRGQITTLWGTYYRWEVAPGTHRVSGLGRANESVTLATSPGSVHFVEHTVRGNPRSGATSTTLRQVDDQYGRRIVQQSQLLP